LIEEITHMNRFINLAPLLAFLPLGLLAQDVPLPPLEVVPAVDLQRYAGTWYEIARLPNRFQQQCVGEVIATYIIREDGDVTVVNRCRLANGEYDEAEGKAKRASDDGPTTKLKVRFAPAFLSILPFVWGDYWIIILAPDYSYAVVGEPSRRYLWILSRTPVMDEAILQDVLKRISTKGYDPARLVMTNQSK
jgi:apolipoprotein D and lipocalin family protein